MRTFIERLNDVQALRQAMGASDKEALMPHRKVAMDQQQPDSELPEPSLTRLRHPLPEVEGKAVHARSSSEPHRASALQLSFSLREKVARSDG
ncbi:hypothetical protein [Pseudomonas mangrovi]|uniref:hypothetical protein n=1 Tax=Pseudomonas mangrovi TaxID=2161748 RepID=UPI0011B29DF5|nr:hypothetical protein [Pseudomonas mangrovi]